MDVLPTWEAVICSLCAGECESGRTFDPFQLIDGNQAGKSIDGVLNEIGIYRTVPEAGVCSACFQLVVTADRLNRQYDETVAEIRERAFGNKDSSTALSIGMPLATSAILPGNDYIAVSINQTSADQTPEATLISVPVMETVPTSIGSQCDEPIFQVTLIPASDVQQEQTVIKFGDVKEVNKENFEDPKPRIVRKKKSTKPKSKESLPVARKSSPCPASEDKTTSSIADPSPDGGMICECCGRLWKDNLVLSKHLSYMRTKKDRPSNERSECPECGKFVRFVTTHLLQVHGLVTKAHCKECDKSFPNILDWRQHRFSVHGLGQDPFENATCKVCGKRFNAKNCKRSLDRHMATHHQEFVDPSKYFNCNVCGKKFSSRCNLEDHMNVHANFKPFACSLCEYRSTRRSLTYDHVKRVHKLTSAEAKLLVQEKEDGGDLKQPVTTSAQASHQPTEPEATETDSFVVDNSLGGSAIHQQEGPALLETFPCEHCAEVFDSPELRHEHAKAEHNEGVVCECCGKRFSDKNALGSHLRNQATKGKKTECDICGKMVVFLYQHKYAAHGAKNREKPTCDQCGEEFINAKKLKHHSYSAHGIGEDPRRRYHCELCERSFSHPNKLYEHLYKDHDEPVPDSKVYKCEVCGKVFFVKSLLEDHVNQHLGEKPFKCRLCDFCTSGRRLLWKHENSVHKRLSTVEEKAS